MSGRLVRSLTGIFALGGASVVTVDCASLTGLDGLADAGDALCSTLDSCFGEADFGDACRERIADRLIPGSFPAYVFLDGFALGECPGSCLDARRCLDSDAVCDRAGARCTRGETCCGFTRGRAVCAREFDISDPFGEVERCCAPLGAPCTSFECCPGAGECDANTNTCGGVVCGLVGDTCTSDFQCCTNVCGKDGRCGEPCLPDSSPCPTPCLESDGFCDEPLCCSGVCSALTGACEPPPSCGAEGTSCDTAADCCPELTCFFVQGDGVCAPGQCFGEGTDCLTSELCCEGLQCDPEFHLCGLCREPGQKCTENGSCCSGLCEGGATGVGECQ
jgi:hypothetical protein